MHLLKLLVPALSVGFFTGLTSGQTCDGIANKEYCCPEACEECGGIGCGTRGNGLTANDCCTSYIAEAGNICGTAPCIIDDGSSATVNPTPSTTPSDDDDGTCSNGVVGIEDSKGKVCCPLSCGECAGTGCSGSECCGGPIQASGIYCSDSLSSPCIIDGVGVAATPAPASRTATLSPSPVMTIPTSCGDDDTRPGFRFAASTGMSGRMYAEGSGCFTMTDLYNLDNGVSKGPVYVLDGTSKVEEPTEFTGKWLLEAELHITGGAIFYCMGTDIGGDCDELRIESLGPDAFHEVRGHGGSMYFENTIVTSWDTPNGKPQEEYEGGRSFLNCVSEFTDDQTCEGNAKNDAGECRMDIINTEVGYLGYFDSESYGLTYKVRGFCTDKSNPEVFDTTNVYGDIIGSDIHHNYYGHYSYGHQGGVWENNKMHDNHQYGFDPHDDSDYLTIANNLVYNNVNHGIIASKRCNNVKIYDNIVRDGGELAAGIFLHRSSDQAEVFGNVIENMQDAGIAMLESMDAHIYDNTITGAKYGIRMSLGSANNNIVDNIFTDITHYGLYTYEGSDEPDVSNGRSSENTFTSNTVENCDIGVKIKEGDLNSFIDNTFINVNTFEFPDSTDTTWIGNMIDGGCIEEDDLDDLDLTDGSDEIPTC